MGSENAHNTGRANNKDFKMWVNIPGTYFRPKRCVVKQMRNYRRAARKSPINCVTNYFTRASLVLVLAQNQRMFDETKKRGLEGNMDFHA
jgi:hypothetical protein